MSEVNNNNSDEIKVSFSVSRSFISSQIAIVLGAGALCLFSNNATMRKFIIFAFVIDIIGVIFYFITRNKNAEGEENETEEEKVTEESMDVQVEHNNKTSTEGVKNVEGVIKNRVTTPQADIPHRTRRKASEPTVNVAPTTEEIPEENLNVEEDSEPMNLNEDVQTDWGGFF